MEINEYDFNLLKMYASPNRCYTTEVDSRELTNAERLDLIYDKLLEIENRIDRQRPQ